MPFSVDISLVKQTEKKLGIQFPPAYVVRMCRDNGGEVTARNDDWSLFPIFDDSNKKRLRRTCNDVVRETAKAREWKFFPPNAVAIAHNGTADKLILVAKQASSTILEHAVYWWDHETGDIHRVADGFDDL